MLGTSVHSSFLAELSALHPRFNLPTTPIRYICKTPHGINSLREKINVEGSHEAGAPTQCPRADEARTAF